MPGAGDAGRTFLRLECKSSAWRRVDRNDDAGPQACPSAGPPRARKQLDDVDLERAETPHHGRDERVQSPREQSADADRA